MSTVKLNFTDQCWASWPCDYFITIHYKQCIQNKVPNFLSESLIETAVQPKFHQLMKSKPYYVLSFVKYQDDHEEVLVPAGAVNNPVNIYLGKDLLKTSST